MVLDQRRSSDRAVVRAPTAIELRRRPQSDCATDATAAGTAGGPRQAIAWSHDYAAAEQVVDLLVARGFPVEHVCITGEGLRLVEEVNGRLTYGVVTLRGAIGGGALGLLLGAGFAFAGLADPLFPTAAVVAVTVLVGILAGGIVSSIGRWLEEGRRDFLSRTRLEATRYGVLCDREQADAAESMLARYRGDHHADRPG